MEHGGLLVELSQKVTSSPGCSSCEEIAAEREEKKQYPLHPPVCGCSAEGRCSVGAAKKMVNSSVKKQSQRKFEKTAINFGKSLGFLYQSFWRTLAYPKNKGQIVLRNVGCWHQTNAQK